MSVSDVGILAANLPAGVTFVSAIGSGSTSFNTSTGIWTIGDLATSATATLTVRLTVGASASDTLEISNTATLAGVTPSDSNAANNSQTVSTSVDRRVDIAVSKSTLNNPVIAGSGAGNLVYTVTATNNGPSNASGVSIRDNNLLPANLPAGVTFVSAVGDGGSTYNSTTGIWTINNLSTSATRTLTVTLTVGASAQPQTFNNIVAVETLNETDRDLNNNSAAATTEFERSVDIEVRKTATTGPIIAGSGIENLVYTITARNLGPSNASSVSVSDVGILAANLPAGVTFVSAIGSGTTSFNTSTGIWTIGDLATSATATLTVRLTVGASASDTLEISNTATLAGVTPSDSNAANNSQTVSTSVDRRVDIAVSKLTLNNPVTAGSGIGNLVYTITARNNGVSNASGVTISDTDILAANLPAGVSFVSAVGSGTTTYSTTTGLWTVGNLAVGASATLTVTLTVGASASDTLVISNLAALATVNETDTVAANNSQTVTTNVDRRVDISVSKSTLNNPVIAGSGTGNLVYTITATNNGPSNASGVSVRDNNLLPPNLPAGVTFVSAVGDGGSTYNSTTGIWTINNLSTSATRTLTVTLTVGASAQPQTFNNTVVVETLNETDRDLNNNSAAATTEFERSVDIEVLKSATTGPIIAGSGIENLVYTITARNLGPSNASSVSVSDTGILAANLPAGVTFVSAIGSGSTSFNTSTGIWTIGDLATSATATLTVRLTVGASASDTLQISNTATLAGVTPSDSNAANNSQTVITNVDRSVDIVVEKSATPANVAAGSGVGNLVFTVTSRNAGISNASGVTISDLGVLAANLPAGVSLVSATGSNGTTFNTTTGIWTIGNLDAGASRTLTLTLTVASTAAHGIDISNTATVSAVAETETSTNNNTQTAVSRVTGIVNLRIQKTSSPSPIESPGVLTYTILVTNNGTAPATGVVVTDNLGTGLTFVSGSSTQGTVTSANGIVTGNIGTLASGATATLTLQTNVDMSQDGTLVNTAVVTSTEPDTDPDNNTTSIETPATLARSSISGVVFQDLNQNGLRDSNEQRLANVSIVVFGIDANGTAVNRQTVTDSNGAYTFTNLVPGRYSVYEIQPSTLLDGSEIPGTGATATVGNDAFLNLQLSPRVNATAFNFTEGAADSSKRPFLASSQSVGQTQVVSLPVTGTGSLSGTVATDANRSNTLDAGDVGIPGVLVTLSGNDSAGNSVVIHQTTDTLGRFSFRNLPSGQFSILETQPRGRTDGAEQAGTILPDEILDNVFSLIALASGGSGTGYNFLELPTTPGVTTATSPTLLTPSSNVGLRPTISWTSLASAARYEVVVNQITGNVGQVYRNANVSGTSVTIPTDLAIETHRVWVRSINSSGVSGPWSQPLVFNVATQVNGLGVLGVIAGVTPTFNWSDAPNATSYDLRVMNVTTGVVLANVSNLPTSEYAGLSSLPPGKYRYFVRGNTAASKGLWSDGYDYTVLSVPTLKSATSTENGKPVLHWNPVTGAATYEVWLSKVMQDGRGQRITTVNKTNATSIPVLTTLELGNYRYWVRSIDSQGNTSAWSVPSDFKVQTAGTMLAPSGTQASSKPTFTWQPVAGAIRYDVWVTDQAGQIFVRERNATGTSFTPAKEFVNGNYKVWVMPIGTEVQGSWSAPLPFSIKSIARPVITSPLSTSNGKPKIQWSAIANAARYELWVDKIGGPAQVIFQSNLTTNTYTPATALQSGEYRAWVRAIDGAGDSSNWSPVLRFRVG